VNINKDLDIDYQKIQICAYNAYFMDKGEIVNEDVIKNNKNSVIV
jgi:hypothetical protein